MKPLDLLLSDIQSHPEFKELLIHLEKARPTIPLNNGDNVEQWKIQSGRQQGFDSCLAIMKIKLGD